jgi:hypothetical protein
MLLKSRSELYTWRGGWTDRKVAMLIVSSVM